VKTTIDIPDEDLADAIRFTGAKTKREAVVRAMQEFNRRQRMASLIKYSGTFGDDFLVDPAIQEADQKRDRLILGEDRR